MAPEKFKRKLTAILSADVKGYSRLMGEDEEGTIRTLNAYMEIIAGFIQQHRGRVVATGGDSVLAEFTSVVDAVRCAVGIQEELKDRNKELSEDRRMEFRIGINLGDVVQEGENILGDGVNVAARVQSVAEAGGICISGTVYDQVKNKLAFSYDYIGEQAVKNIKEPVRIYRVVMEPEIKSSLGAAEGKVEKKPRSTRMVALGIVIVIVVAIVIGYLYLGTGLPPREIGSKEKITSPLSDKPSIAVLPFTNLSDDPKQTFLGDALAEEVINGLAKLREIFVIARNSSFTYKGKAVDVKQIGREQGVRYVLEGSVQRSGDRLRITAQLIDTVTGNPLFSERYERRLEDIFAIQDDITMKILTAMRVAMTEGEAARVMGKGTGNLEAYLKVMQAMQLRQNFNKESFALSRQLAEEAINLDPGYALAYSCAALAISNEVFLGAYKDPKEALERATKLAERGVALDDSLAYPHSILSWLRIMNREYDKGVVEAERAVALEPGSVISYSQLGTNLFYAGQYEEAIRALKQALRLSPIPPTPVLTNLGHSYRMLGRYEESIAILKQLIKREPDAFSAHLSLTATYMLAGKEAEARAQVAEVLRINPNFSLERFAKTTPMKNQLDLMERYIEPARKAGLK
jgi:adenylate cyclase